MFKIKAADGTNNLSGKNIAKIRMTRLKLLRKRNKFLTYYGIIIGTVKIPGEEGCR